MSYLILNYLLIKKTTGTFIKFILLNTNRKQKRYKKN